MRGDGSFFGGRGCQGDGGGGEVFLTEQSYFVNLPISSKMGVGNVHHQAATTERHSFHCYTGGGGSPKKGDPKGWLS